METLQEKYARVASRLLGVDLDQYAVDQTGTPDIDSNNPDITLYPSNTLNQNPYFEDKPVAPHITPAFGE
jgi:hypothetical protein